MLKSSLLILLLINIFIDKLLIIFITTFILIILNLVYNKNLKINIGRIKFLFFLYFTTCFLQLFYTQEGRVLFKIYSFYITEEGLYNFSINFLRILNLLLLSWIINAQGLISGKFNRYHNIIENVIELVPKALILIKKRMRIKWFFRYILKQIRLKNDLKKINENL